MSLLGSGFNPADPGDDDLAKYGAGWIRDIKTRLKAWAGVMFNLNTGRIKDNVIVSAMLKSLSPSPAGTFNWGTVNTKGLVTAAQDVEFPARGVVINEMFIGTTAAAAGAGVTGDSFAFRWNQENNAYEEEFGVSIDNSNDPEATSGVFSAEWTWTVPEGVSLILVECWGPGGGGGLDAGTAGGGAGGDYTQSIFTVEPEQQFTVWAGDIGLGQTGSASTEGGLTKFQLDSNNYAKAWGGQRAVTTTPGVNSWSGRTAIGQIGTEIHWGVGAPGGDGGLPEGGASGHGHPGKVTNAYPSLSIGRGGRGGTVAGGDGGISLIRIQYAL